METAVRTNSGKNELPVILIHKSFNLNAKRSFKFSLKRYAMSYNCSRLKLGDERNGKLLSRR